MRVAVTGAYGFSGKYIARRLLDQRHEVITLTNSPVINTWDEVKGLMQERLYVDSPPLGATKLSEWVRGARDTIGRDYASELGRRLDRKRDYRAY